MTETQRRTLRAMFDVGAPMIERKWHGWNLTDALGEVRCHVKQRTVDALIAALMVEITVVSEGTRELNLTALGSQTAASDDILWEGE